MRYHYKNLPLLINGGAILATSYSFNSSNNYRTQRNIVNGLYDQKTGGMSGSLSVDFVLNGNTDNIRTALENKLPISGNMGGLYFTGGYVESLSINLTEYDIARASANIVFWGEVGGNLSNSNITPPSLSIVSSNGEYDLTSSVSLMDNITSVSYQHTSGVNPIYTISSDLPVGVYFENPKRTLRVSGNNLGSYVKLNGLTGTASIDIAPSGFYPNLNMNGLIISENLSVSDNEILSGDIEIEEILAYG